MQLSFRWPVSFQYQHSKSWFKDPSAPGASWHGLGFPRYGLLTNPVPLESAPLFLVTCEPNFRLVVTAWLIVLTSNFLSRRPCNCLFWFCRLVICACYLLILFWHCLELLDRLPTKSLIWLTSVSMLTDVADDQLCLACPPNIVSNHPWNLVNDISSGEDYSALWVIAA